MKEFLATFAIILVLLFVFFLFGGYILFDFSDNSKRDFIIDYFLHVDEPSLKEAFDKASVSLVNILQEGITEDDYEQNKMKTLIQNNLVSNVSKRQITVITTLLEQVIVPNLVVDEIATENAKTKAQESIQPYTVTFQKGEKRNIVNM